LFEHIFERAGLYPDEQLKPDAVRAWAGWKLFEDIGDIREVAWRLGLRSLDKAAQLINLDDLPHDTPPSHRRRG
jgi:integrase/recombinase XerC